MEAAIDIPYNRLRKLLVDRKMSKDELRKATGIAPNTMTNLRRDEAVSLTILSKLSITASLAGKTIKYKSSSTQPLR